MRAGLLQVIEMFFPWWSSCGLGIPLKNEYLLFNNVGFWDHYPHSLKEWSLEAAIYVSMM